MGTHRIDKDGVFMPRTVNRPDGARYRYVRRGEAVKEWLHPCGQWLPFPPRDDIEVEEISYGNDTRGAQMLVTWGLIGAAMLVGGVIAWIIWGGVLR